MSLFYNRDRNIKLDSTLISFDFNPQYGSSINFNCKKNIIPYNDFTYSMMPSTLNNIVAECNFSFTKEKETAQKMMDFFESQSGTGAFQILDNSDIYRTFTGFADEFDISMQNNNLYNINLKFNVERNSSMLQWKTMSFVKHDFIEWQTGQSYKKYQIVYYPLFDDKTKNFFYSTKDHVSASGDFPLYYTGNWTQSLFYENDFGLSVQSKPKVEINYFKNSFNQRSKTQNNINYFESLQLTYKSISDFKLKSILHFLENSLGYKKFEFDLPQIYNKRKAFYVDSWQHTWKYKDSNDLTVNLVEDPLGLIYRTDIIKKDIIVAQMPTGSITKIGITGFQNEQFLLEYSGFKVFTGEFVENINWGSVTPKNVNITYPISGLSAGDVSNQVYNIYFGSGASVLNADCKTYGDITFSNVSNIDNLNLDDSLLKNLRLPSETGIKNISAKTSTITNVDLTNVQNLTGLNLGNSPLSSGSVTNILKNLSNQEISSGFLLATGLNANHQNSDLDYIAKLDYYAWDFELKSFNMRLKNLNSYFVGSPKIYWFQSQVPSFNDNLTWISSTGTNVILNQNFTYQSDTWFYPDSQKTLGGRMTYKSPMQCVLTGSGITDIYANKLGCFTVASFNQNDQPYYPYGLRCLVNFDFNKNYGLFISGSGLYFIDNSNSYLLSGNLEFNKFYNFGFVRDNNMITGYINGKAVKIETVAANSNTQIEMSVGSSTGGNFLNGNIADVLVFGGTSSIGLDLASTGKFFSGYAGKYGSNSNLI